MLPEFVADFTATGFSKHAGRALDAAAGGIVRVRRRGEVFVLLGARQFEAILRDAGDPRPKTLEAMLVGYDAGEVRAMLGAWLADVPMGSEAV